MAESPSSALPGGVEWLPALGGAHLLRAEIGRGDPPALVLQSARGAEQRIEPGPEARFSRSTDYLIPAGLRWTVASLQWPDGTRAVLPEPPEERAEVIPLRALVAEPPPPPPAAPAPLPWTAPPWGEGSDAEVAATDWRSRRADLELDLSLAAEAVARVRETERVTGEAVFAILSGARADLQSARAAHAADISLLAAFEDREIDEMTALRAELEELRAALETERAARARAESALEHVSLARKADLERLATQQAEAAATAVRRPPAEAGRLVAALDAAATSLRAAIPAAPDEDPTDGLAAPAPASGLASPPTAGIATPAPTAPNEPSAAPAAAPPVSTIAVEVAAPPAPAANEASTVEVAAPPTPAANEASTVEVAAPPAPAANEASTVDVAAPTAPASSVAAPPAPAPNGAVNVDAPALLAADGIAPAPPVADIVASAPPAADISAPLKPVEIAAPPVPVADGLGRVATVAGRAASKAAADAIAPLLVRDLVPAPGLRRALVALAREDTVTAGALIAGLLPAQGAVLEGGLSYDLTVRGFGTFAITVTGAGPAEVQRLTRRRPRKQAAFHLAGDPLVLAELLAGESRKLGRFRRDARLTGRRRRARALRALPAAPLTLAGAALAGARLEPALIYAALPFAIAPEWTRGHVFTVAQEIHELGPRAWYVTARDGVQLSVVEHKSGAAADATVTMSRAAFDRLLKGEPPAHGDRPLIRGDHTAVAALKRWTDLALG